jgi:hypothetical protein
MEMKMHYQIKKMPNAQWVIWSRPLNETREGYWHKHSIHKSRKIAMQYAAMLAGWSGKIEIIA